MRFVLLLGIVLAWGSVAFAYPTLTGPTGYAVLPSADVVAPGELSLAADSYDTSSNTTIPVRLTYGIAEGFEAGAEYEIDEGDYILGFHGKWAAPVASGRCKAALGALWLDGRSSDWTTTQVYLAVTGALSPEGAPQPVTGTIGANWTRLDTGPSDGSAIRAFAALECSVTEKLSACVEYQTQTGHGIVGAFDNHPMSSIAVRYAFNPELSGQIGYTNADEFWGYYKSHTAFVGINYSWSAGAE